MLFRFYKRNRLFVVIIFMIIVIVVLFKNNHNNKFSHYFNENKINKKPKKDQSLSDTGDHPPLVIVEGGNLKYDPKILDLVQLSKCPVCLGHSWCKDINSSSLIKSSQINGKILLDISSSSSSSDGNDDKAKISLLTPLTDLWQAFDQLICHYANEDDANSNVNSNVNSKANSNVNHHQKCDRTLNPAISNTFLSKTDILDNVNNYHNFLVKIFNNKLSLNFLKLNPNFKIHSAFSQCATKSYLYNLKRSFDNNYDKYFDLSEQSHLLTSMLVFPSYLNYKFIQRILSDLPIAKLQGPCGRALLYEGDHETLREFITKEQSFEVVASVLVQVIQLINDLQEEDYMWYFLHTNITLDTIMVSSQKEVILGDLDNIVIIDKSLFDTKTRDKPSLLNNQVCNDPCIDNFNQIFMTNGLSLNQSLSGHSCSLIPHYYGQHMYTMLCKNIFTPTESSLYVSDKELNPNLNEVNVHLLDIIPNKDKENVGELIRECIYETSPGGRKQAIDELKDILKSYLHYEDDNQPEDNYNNPNDNDGPDKNYDDEDVKLDAKNN